MASVNQDGKLNFCRSPQIDQSIHRRANGSTRKQHVIDQDNDPVGNIKGDRRLAENRLFLPQGEVVPILGFSTTQVVGDSTNEMYSLFGAGAPEEALAGLSLASIGCPVDDTECIRFIVAFKSPSQPALIYLIYERPTDGISQPRLIGMGLSGDNADTILNGGVTMTNFGETRFTRVR